MQHALDVTQASPTPERAPAQAERRTPLETIGEVLDLVAGAVAVSMPFMALSLPGIVLFVLLPLILVAVPALLVGLLLAPPLVAVRAARRWSRAR